MLQCSAGSSSRRRTSEGTAEHSYLFQVLCCAESGFSAVDAVTTLRKMTVDCQGKHTYALVEENLRGAPDLHSFKCTQCGFGFWGSKKVGEEIISKQHITDFTNSAYTGKE
eukprot:gb/GEZN01016973.1/.p1 GENE.gb/GEZN01016973.1/~~gb/GEZN01016973.1/.p1  ORF type:complete len:111 (-),score=19.77 gb/GEZN01016973.1/:384-716(-)